MADTTFPDDTGADDFAREYPAAVVPADRQQLTVRSPLLLLQVPQPPERESAETYRAQVKRVVAALREPLEGQGEKLVPHAVAHPSTDDELVAEQASRELSFGIPARMTPDRLCDVALMRDLVTAIRARADTRPADGSPAATRPGADPADPTASTALAPEDAEGLRDYAYERRVHRGGLPKVLWSLGGAGVPDSAGFGGWLLRTFWLSFTHTLPRWWWTRRVTRGLVRGGRRRGGGRRGWLGAELNVTRGREDLFQVMDGVATRQAGRLGLREGQRQREDAFTVLEQLMTLALLADLARPRVGGLLPKRRRRTTRPVVLVHVPPVGEPGARAAERFLRVYARARTQAPTPGPLVIAVGRFSPALLGDIDPESTDLAQAGQALRHGADRPVLVDLAREPFERHGLPLRGRPPRRFRLDWRTQTALCTGGSVLVVASIIPPVSRDWLADSPPTTCVAGEATASNRAMPREVHPLEWYRTALRAIDAQNRRAEELAERGRTVRTIVYFASVGPESDAGTLFDGIVPELRGITLWQKRLNSEAFSDDSRVPLRVEVRDTGRAFARAAGEARKLVAEVEAGHRTGAREVVGVLGFAQSRDTTREALRVLARARIPAVGTTATADEMQVGDYYWPSTPVNSTEARVVASFARNERLVARPGGAGCTPARHAIVVQSSGDLYSRSLASLFEGDFTSGARGDGSAGTAEVVNFSQEGNFDRSDPGVFGYSRPRDLADKVCEALGANHRTVVYWAARTRDFAAFVDALDALNACGQRAVTVLAGNELTNVAQTGEFEGREWLRLYYAAHRLPDADPLASRKTQQFVAAYNAFVAGERGRDPWRDDGQAAVTYDALHALSQAVDLARADNSVGRSAVTTALRSGVSFDGATGSVRYAPGSNAPPRDKTLVILRLTAKGPRTAAACGAYTQGLRYATQGVPCAP
ncbi:ABC transporter substrate-binding protein [Streptomyces sp. NPDC057702]|uniref:ABC transporter substrate-binding protein n=1 Tax=unclassified Streptomyces TaxID=2593676 RepID=UPI003687FAF3